MELRFLVRTMPAYENRRSTGAEDGMGVLYFKNIILSDCSVLMKSGNGHGLVFQIFYDFHVT